MAYDNIPKINSYSLTDFHDFDSCPFRFYVRHHLDRKWDIDESSASIALGHILDQAIKAFHQENCYGTKSSKRLIELIDDAILSMKAQVFEARNKGRHHFYESTIPYITPEVREQAIKTFTDYYVTRKGNIRQAIASVDFCQYIIPTENGDFKIWGGPDTLEMGDDGVPEICDYKSRLALEYNNDCGCDLKDGEEDCIHSRKAMMAKANMDMDLMPKIYTLLVTQKLKALGYEKARFVVRYWQDPLDESYYEEFNLTAMTGEEFLFRQKIEQILRVAEFKMCNKPFCSACKSAKKDEFLLELEKRGFKVMSGEEFLQNNEPNSDSVDIVL